MFPTASLLPILLLSSLLISLSTSLVLSSVLQLPSTQNLTLPSILSEETPWPAAPYRYRVNPQRGVQGSVFYLNFKEFGAPGPRDTVMAKALLGVVSDKVFISSNPHGLIRNRVIGVEGLKVKFSEAGRGLGYGITHMQAARLLGAINDLTALYGAVGVAAGEVEFPTQGAGGREVGARMVERFELT